MISSFHFIRLFFFSLFTNSCFIIHRERKFLTTQKLITNLYVLPENARKVSRNRRRIFSWNRKSYISVLVRNWLPRTPTRPLTRELVDFVKEDHANARFAFIFCIYPRMETKLSRWPSDKKKTKGSPGFNSGHAVLLISNMAGLNRSVVFHQMLIASSKYMDTSFRLSEARRIKSRRPSS